MALKGDDTTAWLHRLHASKILRMNGLWHGWTQCAPAGETWSWLQDLQPLFLGSQMSLATPQRLWMRCSGSMHPSWAPSRTPLRRGRARCRRIWR